MSHEFAYYVGLQQKLSLKNEIFSCAIFAKEKLIFQHVN